jgi:vacuolar-type H+-ATPase subunit I/STV1
MKTEILIEIVGWLGVLFYLLGYFLLTIGKLKASSYKFHLLNIFGASGLITDSAYYYDMPNLVVNAAWLLIAVFAVVKRKYSDSKLEDGTFDQV